MIIIQVLLAEPNPEDPLVPEIANMFRFFFHRHNHLNETCLLQNAIRYEKEEFEEKAKMMTQKHAGKDNGGKGEEIKAKRVCDDEREGKKKMKT